jgi:Lrp/AsnC family transcriptional regulator for asnA, asnC and gidA
MRIVAITDPDILGYRLRATLCLRIAGDIEPVVTAMEDLDEVDFVVATAGTYDLLVELQCEDEAALDAVLNGVIRKIPGVSVIDTMIYLRLHKSTYAWPPGSRQAPGGAL